MRRGVDLSLPVVLGQRHLNDNVAGLARQDRNRSGSHRLVDRGHDWERVVVDKESQPRLRPHTVGSHHHRDGLTDPSHGVDCETRTLHGRHGPGEGGRKVGRSPYSENAGQVARRSGVDGGDARVGDGAADERHRHRPGQPDIVHELTTAGQQRRILLAQDGRSDRCGDASPSPRTPWMTQGSIP